MKIQKTIVPLIAMLALAAQQHASAVVGYVNYTFQTGSNFFGNPLHSGTDALNVVITNAPEGTSIWTWNAASLSFSEAATFNEGAWIGNPVLAPGTGALLVSPSSFLHTYVGEVAVPIEPYLPPPPFAGPNGLYLWNNKLPASGASYLGYSLFEMVVGRMPNDNEAFYRWNGSDFDAMTYDSDSGYWLDPYLGIANPSLNIGEAGFFDIGGTGASPVPEPGSLTIVVLGLVGIFRKRLFR